MMDEVVRSAKNETFALRCKCKWSLLGLRRGWVGYANGHELNYPSQKDAAACIATDDPRLKRK